jgi:hypothetical protein
VPTIDESRRAFLDRLKRYARGSEYAYFEVALDDFIRWSANQVPELVHFDKEYKQNVVSFQFVPREIVFWSAYPQEKGGAKLEIMPRSADTLSESVRRDALQTLRSISTEDISESTTLRISFTALKAERRRMIVKELLSRVLASLAQ